MKKVLIAVTVMIALGVVAQRGKVETDAQDGGVKVVNPNNVKLDKKGDVKMTTGITTGKPNTPKAASTSAAVEKEVVDYTAIGKERADEARAKYAEPKTGAEADEMIKMANESTMKTVAGVDSKLASAETMIEQMHDSGEMSDMEYESNKAKLEDFKRRSESVSGKMK